MTDIQCDALFLSKELYRVQFIAEKYYGDNSILKLKYLQTVMPMLLLECCHLLRAMSEAECKTSSAAAAMPGLEKCNTL